MEDKLPSIYKQVGADYDDRVLPSLGNEVLKAVVAQVKKNIPSGR